mgnify:CR=1 FL=1
MACSLFVRLFFPTFPFMLLVLNVTILHSQVSIKNIAGITYSTERFSCLICPQILLASFWLQRQDYRLEGI